jgi:hypothetical protein
VANDAYPLYRIGQCRTCPAGTATMDGFRCIPCQSGYYSAAGARECTPCAVGTITVPSAVTLYGASTMLSAGVASCKTCPAGYYQPRLGGTVCLPCPAGEQ